MGVLLAPIDRSCASVRDEHEAPHGGGSNYTNPADESPNHAVARSCGVLSTKIRQLVDSNGLPMVALLTAGQAAAEDRLFERARTTTAPTVRLNIVARVTSAP